MAYPLKQTIYDQGPPVVERFTFNYADRIGSNDDHDRKVKPASGEIGYMCTYENGKYVCDCKVDSNGKITSETGATCPEPVLPKVYKKKWYSTTSTMTLSDFGTNDNNQKSHPKYYSSKQGKEYTKHCYNRTRGGGTGWWCDDSYMI